MKRYLFPILVFFVLGIYCDGIEGSGEIVTQEYPNLDFDSITAESNWDLEIISGDEPYLEIRIDNNIEEFVQVTVNGGDLEIALDSGSFTSITTEATVTLPILNALNLGGNVEANFTNFLTSFSVDIHLESNATLNEESTCGELVVGGASVSLNGNSKAYLASDGTITGTVEDNADLGLCGTADFSGVDTENNGSVTDLDG